MKSILREVYIIIGKKYRRHSDDPALAGEEESLKNK